jgi:hypothetical protein
MQSFGWYDPMPYTKGTTQYMPGAPFWLSYERYVKQVGEPRVVACDIDISGNHWVYKCRSHNIGFQERERSLSNAMSDRCPVSRLEEWRQRRWEYAHA